MDSTKNPWVAGWKDRLIALLNNLKEYQNASIEENITIKG